MRSMVFAAFGAAAATLMLAAGAFAQPAPAPSAQPGAPTGPAVTPPAGAGVSVGLGSDGAEASSTGMPADTGVEEEAEPKEEATEKLAWRGSRFIFSQSATTTTVGIGDDYLSDNPVYEMNFSLRPRYYVYDDDVHSIHFNARVELTKELTNSDSTTKENETLFENIILNAVYGVIPHKDDNGLMTKFSIGPRVVIPTAKASWKSGQRLQLGGGITALQAFPVGGVDASFFPTASISGRFYYLKPINKTTTGENEDFERMRTDVNANAIISNQISASARVKHQATATAELSLDLTEKLHLSSFYVWIMQWPYTFGETEIHTSGVEDLTIKPDELEDSTSFRVVPWFLASLDYDLLPEVGIGAGYYNATSQIGPDGERRSPFYSPDARFFFDITANLDQIYMTLSGDDAESTAKANARARHEARVKNIEASAL